MTAPKVRLPKSPEQLRAAKAARQRRWRENAKKKQIVAENVDYAAGLGPPPKHPLPATPATSDIATLMRDRLRTIIATLPDEMLMSKDLAPMLNVALKAQGQLDAREKAQSKKGNAELAFAIIAMLTGNEVPKALDDGLTIDGVAEEVDAPV